jgi:hypothetical protein
MTPSDERTLAHARAIRARGLALPPEGLPPGQILDSWVRCMGSRLDPNAPMEVPVVLAGDLAQRRERGLGERWQRRRCRHRRAPASNRKPPATRPRSC